MIMTASEAIKKLSEISIMVVEKNLTDVINQIYAKGYIDQYELRQLCYVIPMSDRFFAEILGMSYQALFDKMKTEYIPIDIMPAFVDLITKHYSI